MKKWLVLGIIAAIVGIGYYMLITFVTYTPPWLAGEKTKVERGDIRAPITASGRVQPRRWIEIKPEASGEVTHILVEEGDFVLAGDTLVVLDPNDEQRNVEIAQLQLQDAETQLAIAEEQAIKAREAGITQAEANLAVAQAEEEQAEVARKKLEGLEEIRRTEYELSLAVAKHEGTQARVKAAGAAKKAAESDARLAAKQVDLSQKAVETAKRNLSEAQERLDETIIKAPQDAMVSKMAVQVGQLVQSGTKSLTGGTALLKLADTGKLYVVAMVDDADFGLIRKIAPPEARPQMKPGLGAQRAKRLEREKAIPDRNTTQPATAGANPGPMSVEQDETPTTAPDLKPEQRVKVLVDTFPDEDFWGVIERIDPEGEVHGAIVQYRVHVRLVSENSYEMLMLGLPAQVEFTAESREDVLKVESRCIRKRGDEYGVYVPAPTQQDALATRFVPVRTGITDGTYTEVLPGSELKEGQTIYLKPPQSPKERGKD